MIKALVAVVIAGLGAAFVPAVAVLALLGSGIGGAGACLPGGSVTVTTTALPASVAGYSGDQLANAAVIITTGADLAVPARGQAIAVMTAMGESSLRVVDHGDTAGPDSRGLFQQRDNGAWGTYADRMNPATSAAMFYRALLAVPGWETLEPTLAAHAVQRNADPNHYTRYWPAALEVVTALTGADRHRRRRGLLAGGRRRGRARRVGHPRRREDHLRLRDARPPRHRRPHPARRASTSPTAAAPPSTPPPPAPSSGPAAPTRAAPATRSSSTTATASSPATATSSPAPSSSAPATPSPPASRSPPWAATETLDPIGAGNSTGCHLHFEINTDSGRTPVDPSVFLARLE